MKGYITHQMNKHEESKIEELNDVKRNSVSPIMIQKEKNKKKIMNILAASGLHDDIHIPTPVLRRRDMPRKGKKSNKTVVRDAQHSRNSNLRPPSHFKNEIK